MDEKRKAWRIMEKRPERKRPNGKPASGWEDNIKMDLK
jgi:hypothetical protein